MEKWRVESMMPSRRDIFGYGGGLLAGAAIAAHAAAQTTTHEKAPGGTSETGALPATPQERAADTAMHCRTATINGIEIFYREAGPKDGPVVVLLHGFPSSSRMFRNLIPLLSDKYHVIAPDYPAFGHSATPSRMAFTYSHAHISDTMGALLDTLKINRFAMYVMDFGGPIGYQLMLKHPERVSAIVVQNAPAFGEPTDGAAWAPLLAYWKNGSAENREKAHFYLTPEWTRSQYVTGVSDISQIDPDNWLIDHALLDRPGVDEIMLDLLYDIKSNVPVVAAAREFFRVHQPPMLIATGANDVLFPGESMRPDPQEMPKVEFHTVDSGHFALENKCTEIAGLMHAFLDRTLT